MKRFNFYKSFFLYTGIFFLAFLFSCNSGSSDTEPRTDAEVEKTVMEQLDTLPGYGAVQVEVRNGIAYLTGQCEGAGCAERLSTAIKKIDGVMAVENDITEGQPVAR